MEIPKELIQQYANTKKISYNEAVSLIGDTIDSMEGSMEYEEAKDIVRQCLEIIVRTVK